MRHVLAALAAVLPLLSSAQVPADPPAAPAPVPAQAWQPTRSTYVFARLGMVIPQHDDLDGFDNGFALEGGLGFAVAPNLALELGIGRFAISAEQSAYDPYYGPIELSLQASAVPLTGSLKFFGGSGGVEFYGLAGLGLYFMSMDMDASVGTMGTVSESDSDTSPGFHFGGGFSAEVSPQVRLGLEGKYIIAEGTFFDTDGNLNSLIITGGLAFRF